MDKTVITPANGIIYVDVTPTSTGTITVTATKKCYVSGSDEIKAKPKITPTQLVLIVKPVDAQNKDKKLYNATVEVYWKNLTRICRVTDEGVGDIALGDPGNISISSDLIHIPARDIWIVVTCPGYNNYYEHGVDLVAPGIPKEIVVEMTKP
ncbi:hypothetical protein DRO02_08125 [archaeon]|nr:MAG: hypothetical protein DRO02_08125 [archaeon]